MTASPTGAHPKRKWYELTLRHLRMSLRLLRAGFPDGAYFHAYHAYECAVSALIAARGYNVPPEGKVKGKPGYYPAPAGHIPANQSTHQIKLLMFDKLADRSKPYFSIHSKLKSFMPVNARMTALYYDATSNRMPHDIHKYTDALAAYHEVRIFAREVWKDIR
jgi:hypothetical protein